MCGSEELAVGGSAARRVDRGVKEGEWAKKSNGGVKEGNSIGPCNVGFSGRSGSGGEEDAFVVINNTIRGSGEAVPKGPEAAGGVRA